MMQTEVIKIRGMNSEGCIDKVNNALKSVKGVGDVVVSLAGNKATVQFDAQLTSSQELQATLARAGYSIVATSSDSSCGGGCCGGCGGN